MQPRAFGKKTSTSTTTPDVDERPTHRNDRKHIYNNKPLHNSTTKNRNNIDTMHQIQKNVDTKCRTAMSPQTHTHTHAKPQKNDGWLRHMHSATLDGLKTINNDNLFTPTQWGRKSQNATTKVPPHTHTHTRARKNPPRNEQTEHTESLTHMLPHNKTIDDGPNTRLICQPTTRAMTKNCNMHRVFLKLHILSRLEHKPFSPLNFKTPFDF
ncbi:MAG: hypothetical protein QGH82_02170 [Candidatus Woesearchaeota archaeon]|nr:hypothetical protein [Candidatus Woesearchaeota archaeon]